MKLLQWGSITIAVVTVVLCFIYSRPLFYVVEAFLLMVVAMFMGWIPHGLPSH
jgi:hypothetical protein